MVIYAYFKLVRFPILILIAIIQYSVRYFVLEPMLKINGFDLIMGDLNFAILVLSSILIAGGGYAINDYFDAKIDRLNKPKLVVLDRVIKRRIAMALHIGMTAIGFILATYVSYVEGMWKMNTIFLFIIFALWFYSTNLKQVFLAGNIIIALLAAFVPLIVGLFEIPLQNKAHPEIISELGFSIFNIPAYWIIGYSLLFGFLTLIREITKDIIDMKGDKAYGGNTIPISLGIKSTKTLLIFLYATFALLLSGIYNLYLSVHSVQITSIVVAIILGMIVQISVIYMAKTKPQFKRSANLNNAMVVLLVVSMFFLKQSIESYFFG